MGALFALACNASCSFRTFAGGTRLTPISRLSPLRALTLNQGPFPPPGLAGFHGTMGLSDTSDSPTCPSRPSGWESRLPPSEVSRVASDLPVQTCRRHYPGGTTGGVGVAPLTEPVTAAFPIPLLGRLPH